MSNNKKLIIIPQKIYVPGLGMGPFNEPILAENEMLKVFDATGIEYVKVIQNGNMVDLDKNDKDSLKFDEETFRKYLTDFIDKNPEKFSSQKLDLKNLSEEELDLIKGEDGKPFTFEDLTEEQKESLRGLPGPPGNDGEDGKDGKSLTFEDLTDEQKLELKADTPSVKLSNYNEDKDLFEIFYDNGDYVSIDFSKLKIRNNKVNFEDLTEEQKEALRGLPGPKGDDGDFKFNFKNLNEEQKEFLKKIQPSISLYYDSIKNNLNLSYDYKFNEENAENDFEKYDDSFYNVNDTIELSDSPLKYKNLFFIGDSITEKNFRANKNYIDYIKDKVGNSLTTVNLGFSGTGFSDRWNNINKQIDDKAKELDMNNLNKNPGENIISVFLGVNDFYGYSGKDPLGGVENLEKNTISAYIYALFSNLTNKFYNNRILIITPLPSYKSNKMNNAKNEYGYSLEELVNNIKELAYKFSLPVLDLFNESNLRPWNEHNKVFYFSYDGSYQNADGLHPNDNGHALISNKIQKFYEENSNYFSLMKDINFSIDEELNFTEMTGVGNDIKMMFTYPNDITMHNKKSFKFNIDEDLIDFSKNKLLGVIINNNKKSYLEKPDGFLGNTPYWYTVDSYPDNSNLNSTSKVQKFIDNSDNKIKIISEKIEDDGIRKRFLTEDLFALIYADKNNDSANSKDVLSAAITNYSSDENKEETNSNQSNNENTTLEKLVPEENSDGSLTYNIPSNAVNKISWKKDQSFLISLKKEVFEESLVKHYIINLNMNNASLDNTRFGNSTDISDDEISSYYFYFYTLLNYEDGKSYNRTSEVSPLVEGLEEISVDKDGRISYKPIDMQIRIKKK